MASKVIIRTRRKFLIEEGHFDCGTEATGSWVRFINSPLTAFTGIITAKILYTRRGKKRNSLKGDINVICFCSILMSLLNHKGSQQYRYINTSCRISLAPTGNELGEISQISDQGMWVSAILCNMLEVLSNI